MAINKIGSCFTKIDEQDEGGGNTKECHMDYKEQFKS